jgi:hypothetical protein
MEFTTVTRDLSALPDAVRGVFTGQRDILLGVNGEGAKLPQAVGGSPTTARLPELQCGMFAGLQFYNLFLWGYSPRRCIEQVD